MGAERERRWTWDQPGGYDAWTAAETSGYYERYHDILDMVVVRGRVRPGDRVLDIGTGTGELARRFAVHRGCRVLGLDPSPGMVNEARRKAHQGQWGDVAFCVVHTPFLTIPCADGALDAVASTYAFHHVPERHKVAAVCEMARVLRSPDSAAGRPPGRLVIGDPMFRHREEMDAALSRWSDWLEEEYFALLETLEPAFCAAGLTFHAEQLTRLNWVVWGERGRDAWGATHKLQGTTRRA